MNQELLNKINDLHHEICDFIVNYKGKDFTKTKKFKELNHEVNSLTYKYNKENKVYWDYQGQWIHDKLKEIRERVPKNLTGNAITKFVAMELNKLNGLVLEEIWVNGALNYSIALVTPYTIYHYNLLRGYDYYCNLEQAKFANDGTNKSKVAFKPATHPVELVYDLDKEDVEEYGSYINYFFKTQNRVILAKEVN